MCIPRCRSSKASRYQRLESVDSFLPRPFSPANVRRYHTSAGSLDTVRTSRIDRMTMGQPPPSTPQKFTSPLMTIGGSSAMNHPLGAQHERLILELLPFNDSATFHEWLQSESVKGSFNEFTRDLLQNNQGQNFPDPNKEQTAKAAEKAIQKKDPRFLLYHPNKSGWTPEDHHVRFIVTVALDNVLTNTWSLKSGGTNSTAKAVYEVLAYLKASLVVNEQNPPGYSQ